MMISKGLLDELLEGCERPEDLLGVVYGCPRFCKDFLI